MLMTENPQPLLANSTIYLVIALKRACFTALAQAPLFLLRLVDPHFIVYGGWILILGYTLYRVWELNSRSLVINDLTVVQLLGCIAAMGISVAFLYGTTIALDNPDSDNPVWQIKAVFITNPFLALNIASLAMVGTFILSRVHALLDWPKL